MTREELIELILEARTNTTPAGRLKFATHGRMIYGHRGSNAMWKHRKEWTRATRRYHPAWKLNREKWGLKK